MIVDEKFKDCNPNETVNKILDILSSLGIEVHELWNDTGLDNCYSLFLYAFNGAPSSNGKGVTKALARASAYGEFIERLQEGLFLYKYQSIIRAPNMNVHAFAPDARYMTKEQLLDDCDWMDIIVESYNNPLISRETILEYCQIYSLSDNDQILTLPFYSLFEDKYVYLPAAFVDQIYTANGCCAGNSKEEAWVHALSEIMERNATLKVLMSGKGAPKIPLDSLDRFRTAKNIIDNLQQNGEFEIDVFDYSVFEGYPVVATRIINKKNQSYVVNVGSDPVFEIALQRTLTELFQGRNVRNFMSSHSGKILNRIEDYPATSNTMNQLETSNGVYAVDFFADDLYVTDDHILCEDRTNLTNKQLLEYALAVFKKMGKQIYIRNYSFLGFPSYKFIVPGFSETRILRLTEMIPDYAMADSVCKTLRKPLEASDEDLQWVLTYYDSIRLIYSRYNYFGRIAGVPISGKNNTFLATITRAYAFYRLKQLNKAIRETKVALKVLDEGEDQDYFKCVIKYLEMIADNVPVNKIDKVLSMFFSEKVSKRLIFQIKHGQSPYDLYLLNCSYSECEQCRYRDSCSFNEIAQMNKKIGKIYNNFHRGQSRAAFVDCT